MHFLGFLFIIYFILSTSILHGQTNTIYTQCYGGSNNELINQLLPTADNGFVLAGHTWSSDQQVIGQHGSRDMWIVKCDSLGQIEWQRCLGGTDEEAATCIYADSNNYIIGGFASSSNGNVTGHIGEEDFWLVKLSSSNAVQWKKCFGGSYMDQINDVVPTMSGGYLMAGITFSNDGDVSGLHGPPNTWADAWVVKIDQQRNIIWQKCLGGTDADAAYRIIELASGNIIIAASTNSTDGDITQTKGNKDVWMIKLDALGNIVQQKNLGGSFDEAPNDMILTANNHLLLTGYSFSSDGDLTGNYFNGSANWEDVWVLEIDTSFTIKWQKNLGGTSSDIGKSILETPNGFLLAAESASNDFDRSQFFGFKDYWLVQLDTIGNLKWEKSFGETSFDFATVLSADISGKILMGGFTLSTNLCNFGNNDIWILKLDTTTSTSIFEISSNSDFIVTPNPFISEIGIDLSNIKNITSFDLFDSYGKHIFSSKQDFDDLMNINTEGWSKGIYIIRITTKENVFEKRILKVE